MEDRATLGSAAPTAVWFVVAILVLAVVVFGVLGRGKSGDLERRVDSNLPGARGADVRDDEGVDLARTVAVLTRVRDEQRAIFVTEVEIGGESRILVPAEDDPQGQRDVTFLWIREKLFRLKATQQTALGEIRGAVPGTPHADVVRVLDCFLEAGFSDVAFSGKPNQAGMR